MSFKVTAAVYSRVVGGFKGEVEGKPLSSSASIRKAVLAFMADKANDDGSGIWCSKATIAKNIEVALNAVRNAIKSLVADGVLIQVRERPCASGFTWEYAIALDVVAKLDPIAPDTPTPVKSEGVHEVEDPPPHQMEGTPPPDGAKPSRNQLDIPDGISCQEIELAFQAYQDVAAKVGWPKVRLLTDSRKAALTRRLEEHGLPAWGDVLRKAAKSSHCRGDNSSGWRASFDFLTKRANFLKVLEGNYDDTFGGNPTGSGKGSGAPRKRESGFRALLEALEGDPAGDSDEREGPRPLTIDGRSGRLESA